MAKESLTYLNKTKSICGVCGKAIPARVFIKRGRVFITSSCQEHGETTADHGWDDPEIYRGLKKIRLVSGKVEQVVVDTTKKCNLNCAICFARANEYQGNKFKPEDLDRLKEYRQVFFSGGEPTTRKDLPRLLRRCVKNGQKPILFTNGIKLADLGYLNKLKKAGLRSVLLQLDTLNQGDSKYIRGKKLVNTKVKALYNLKKLNIPVSVWTVVVKGKNTQELAKIHRFIFRLPNIKTVSAIPIWRIGRYKEADFVPPSAIIEKLGKIYGINKSEFVATTQLFCNIDRILSLLNKRRGRLFGICMLKALIFEHKTEYISLGKIFNIANINERIDNIFSKKSKFFGIMAFIGYFIGSELLMNFLKNKYFQKVFFKTLWNLRYLFQGRYLLINPFRFITIAIFPSTKNIDLTFIKSCNVYALGCDDYSSRPACLHYIEEERKIN